MPDQLLKPGLWEIVRTETAMGKERSTKEERCAGSRAKELALLVEETSKTAKKCTFSMKSATGRRVEYVRGASAMKESSKPLPLWRKEISQASSRELSVPALASLQRWKAWLRKRSIPLRATAGNSCAQVIRSFSTNRGGPFQCGTAILRQMQSQLARKPQNSFQYHICLVARSQTQLSDFPVVETFTQTPRLSGYW